MQIRRRTAAYFLTQPVQQMKQTETVQHTASLDLLKKIYMYKKIEERSFMLLWRSGDYIKNTIIQI